MQNIWHGVQGSRPGAKKAATLGELLQRMLQLLWRPEDAAALMESTGTEPASAEVGGSQRTGTGLLQGSNQPYDAPSSRQQDSNKRKTSGAKAKAMKRKAEKQQPAGAEPSCKRSRSTSIPQVRMPARAVHIDQSNMVLFEGCEAGPDVQELLAGQLTAARGHALPQLEGRWWKKRWSGERARAVLKLSLEVLQVHIMPS